MKPKLTLIHGGKADQKPVVDIERDIVPSIGYPGLSQYQREWLEKMMKGKTND